MVSDTLDIGVNSKLVKQGQIRKSSLTLPSIIGVFLLSAFICMALANTWFRADVTQLAFEVDELQKERALLKDNIEGLKIEVGKLTSPENIREKIAPKLGMVSPESVPIILER